ncbi:MAG: helix-turn-helix transcriptional regulator [Lachnospiraceae bacterium]|nr:helix-turn-helix transcriptional regulator [Lachnospiraceae bacterium]
MKTWNDYKERVKKQNPELGKDITDVEEQAKIISALIKQRKELGLSQRDLASICGIPQSSVARIESFQTTPNLSTLLKIFRALGLKLTVTK